ncbi:MAG: hypothetical protein E7642_01910 [Ruminococcaceae bacterium]|nr:hypothetical protein [Oscillospiraceae bacterium]
MVRARRLNIRKTIFGGMFVVSLLIIMVFVSYSWFNSGEKATVTGITMNVAEGNNLVIKSADPNSEAQKTLKMAFPEGLMLKAVSGDGIHFYEAKIGYKKDESSGEPTYVKDVVDYTPIDISDVDSYIAAGIFAFDFSFSIETDKAVYIYGPDQIEGKAGSSVVPAIDSVYERPDYVLDEETGIQTPPSWKSPYGNFNVGNICGAVRIAIFQEVEETDEEGNISSYYKPTFIWAPNSTIELYRDSDKNLQLKDDFYYQKSGEGENVTYELMQNKNEGKVEDEYVYAVSKTDEGELQMVEIETGGKASGTHVVDGVTYAWGELTACKIGDLKANTDMNFRIVVWVDGNDRECDNALLAGQINVDLQFGTIDTTNSEDNTDEVAN